jgi:hypothetical protein
LTSAGHRDSEVGRRGVSLNLLENLVPLHIYSAKIEKGLRVELYVAKCCTYSASLTSSRENKVIELNSILIATTGVKRIESLKHTSKRAEVTFASRVSSSRQGSAAVVLTTVFLITPSRMELNLSLSIYTGKATRSVGIALGEATS